MVAPFATATTPTPTPTPTPGLTLSFARQAASLASSTDANPQNVASGDFNQDGRADLVTTDSGNNRVQALASNGNGTFAGPVNVPTANTPVAVDVADVTGDGNLDIVTACASEMSVAVGDGAGNFTAGNNIPTGNNGSQLRGICTGNFDGTGNVDIAVSDASNNSIYVYESAGGGVFNPFNFPSGGALNGPRALVSSDFNGDGRPDLAVANFGSRAQAIWLNAGGNINAVFPQGNASTVNMASNGAACQTILAADFTGDSRGDVFSPDVVQVNQQNQGNFFGNQGNGTFNAPVIYNVGQDPFGSGSADFNLDNKRDIAVATFLGLNGAATGDFEVLLGNGDGTFQAVQAFPLPNGVLESRSVAVGDFNADGKPDAAISGGPTWIFLNTSQ